jgi:two-component system, OmpR family, phosphate regulon sensor histidine kinase PhoR
VWVTLEPHTGSDGDRIAISVRDDGRGIAEKHLPRLTERFYRANDEGGEKSSTGLGLAIVKHAVSRHRGELAIASEAGKGSQFVVALAAAPD